VTFGVRLATAFEQRGHLCVGIDPHPFLLAEWGLTDDAAAVREFGLRVVEATAGRAGIVKPQIAFFERHGSAGFAALEEILTAAREAGLLVIADVKRGDLGTSVEAYGQAWLTPGSPFEADAMTINAYQGVGSISSVAALAQATGKGLFVLAATSNPEGYATQTALVRSGEHAGLTVAASIVAGVNRLNLDVPGTAPLGSLGVVLGATLDLDEFGIGAEMLRRTPILAPGFGHQGAALSDLHALYGANASGVIVSSSREILGAGPHGITSAIVSSADQLRRIYAA